MASIKAQNPEVIVVVDNCYGEFTDTREPPAVRGSMAGLGLHPRLPIKPGQLGPGNMCG